MRHRGPDGESVWSDGDVGLAMTRLAIIDVAHGQQPLVNEDASIHVVFNGELYNHRSLRAELLADGHRLRSETDGEVLPHLYEAEGPGFVERLNGIFAFALWDARDGTLLLARDHLGVKPLYVQRRPDGVVFASELKALLEAEPSARRLDLAALDEYLTFRFTPSPQTLFEGVEKLPPGTTMLVRDGDATLTRYWAPVPVERRDLSLAEAADELRERLRTAVRRQMMSDRPIGAMLSGGIDSAAIVALMAEESSQVKTFTVGFSGGGPDADETALARETAQLFGTDHHDLIVGLGEFRTELDETIAHLEEPVGTSSAVGFRAVSRLARPLVPVLLSGQGADELFAGYGRYLGEWLVSRTPGPLRAVAGAVRVPARLPLPTRLERGLRALGHDNTLERFLQIYAVFTPAQKRELYRADTATALTGSGGRAAERVEQFRRLASGRDSLQQMMYVDTRLWLPDDLLLVGDKMSMAESVEMRVPFLDPTLVEFVESLPSSYKIRRGVRKLVHRRALEPLLPRAIVERPERGFITPVDHWLRTGLSGETQELLLDPDGYCGRLFDGAAIARLVAEHARGHARTRQLFCLLSFELWARRFRPALS